MAKKQLNPTEEMEQEIKEMDVIELAEEIQFNCFYEGDTVKREKLLNQLGQILRNVENTIYWATTDGGYTEEQAKALIDVERERLLDLADIFNPRGE